MHTADHQRVTNKAVRLFHQFTQNSFSEMLEKHVLKIERGVCTEDSLGPYTRATNWHFFKQNMMLHPMTVWYGGIFPLPVTPTSDRVLRRRIRQLRQGVGNESPARLAKRVGRVLHHIQDMSTPAHAVPVYHGPEIKDSFEQYASTHVATELAEITVSISDFEEMAGESNSDILAIYNQAAEKTLHYLFEDPTARFETRSTAGTRMMGWEMFWKLPANTALGCAHPPYKRIPGFGCYGPFGLTFGETSFHLDGQRITLDAAIYKSLLHWVLREQVLNSLQTLKTIQEFN